MFEKYNEQARRALFFARYEASKLGSRVIESEYILMGILRQGGQTVKAIFRRFQVVPDDVRREIVADREYVDTIPSTDVLPLSEESKRILFSASTEAEIMLHDTVAPEHLLIGILRVEGCMASRILTRKGFDVDTLLEVVSALYREAKRKEERAGHARLEQHNPSKVKGKQERLVARGTSIDKRKVFLVHGRNEAARTAMAAFLRSIDLRPIEWSEAVQLTGEASPFIGQVVEAGFRAAQAVVVLLTGDDLAKLRPALFAPTDPSFEKRYTPQARPNVLFEAGFAFGRHPDRTVIVEFGQLRPFSDVQGRNVIRMDNSAKRRLELAERLRTAGCAVNTSGVDWHTEGNFNLT